MNSSKQPVLKKITNNLWHAVAATIISILLFAPSVHAADLQLFGTREIPGSDMSAFDKWTEMLSRHDRESYSLANVACNEGMASACRLLAWDKHLRKLRGLDPRDQVALVNKILNREAYVTDPSNYGTNDYWATPLQFFSNQGDCEDFAIVKYLSLRSLGFPPENMRIVILEDVTTKLPHAVLVVLIDGKALVLDNRSEQVVQHDQIHNYRPYYSLNEAGWWLHVS